ncbi:MAG: hypothetical protein PVH18_04835, partial [Chloroflexota bacterium]
ENHQYDHQDYLAYYAMTETPRILDHYRHEVDPTLLLAREERFRAAHLEAAAMPAGGALTVNLNSTDYPERTLAGLQWTPYRYNADLADWEATPATEYWDILEVELAARFYDIYPDDDPETNLGRVATARAYSFTLINSLATNVVHCTPELLLCPLPKAISPYTDDMLIKATKDFLNGLSAVSVKVIFQTIDSRKSIMTYNEFGDLDRNGDYVALDDFIEGEGWKPGEAPRPEKSLLRSVGEQLTSPWKTVFRGGPNSGPKVRVAGGVVVSAAVAAVIATVVVGAVLGAKGGQIAAMVIRSISVLIAMHCAIAAISAARKVASTVKGFLSSAIGNMGLRRANFTKVGVITTVIKVLLTWGAFVALFYSNDMVVGSMTFDSTLAGTIADTITAVLLFVLFAVLGPIGAIVSAIMGLIDAIANLICSALPEDMQTSKYGSVLCRGITGIISTLFKRWIYSGTILVDMDPKGYDRLSLYNFDTTLVDEQKGLVTGALMRYNIGLTNTIDLVKTPINLHEYFWSGQFNDENLKKTNFDYRWQDEEEAFHAGLSLGGMTDRWLAAADEHRYYAPDAATSEGIPLGAAGINQSLEGLVLSEAYALPEQECWGWRAWSYCSIQAEKSTSHFDIGSSIIYDILPATLDGFYELTSKGDGQSLAWGQEGDLTFPILFDADGDGLPRTDDPDDARWDADGDGLSDSFEFQNGSDPRLKDSDNDGLTDLQEARLGSDPTSADSDGDGLYDCQEVFHQIEVVGDSNAQDECGQAVGSWTGGWDFVYGGAGSDRLITLVTASPFDADSDGDGLTDQQELVYGYNPGATSNLNVLSFDSQLAERIGGVDQPYDGFVAPGQTLTYSATVKNELDNRQAEGLLWTEASDALDVSGIVPQSFNLWPQTQANMDGTLQVIPAASGSYSLTQVAGALIADLSAESDNAALWLRFDDPPGSTTYLDTSGQFPAHDGQCVGSGCLLDTAGGRTGGALKLDGTSYVDVPLDVSEEAYALALWFKTTCTNCGIFSADAGTLGAEGHDRHVYLSGGNVCARIYSNETRCTAYANYADGQWHHLVHTFGGNEGGQKIYLDGVLKVSGAQAHSDFSWQDGINIGFSNDAAVDYFTGSIDDVRIFDDALAQRQVQEMANLPLFHMDFDQSGSWTDVSSFKWPMPICLGDCPTFTSGISGGGAHFNSSSYLSVTAAPHLNLSGGRLTLSAWIYPRPYSSFNQSILGLNAGGGDAYPTLQRVGRQLLFGLGTGSSYLTQITTGNVLTEYQWNHVAVTLDKDAGGENLRFYVNGELVEKFAFPVTTIAPTTSFEIGRADPYASVSMPWYHVYDNGDEGLIYPALEMCATIGGQEVWNETVKNGATAYPTFNVPFRNRTTLVIFEDDGDTPCGTGRDDHDDTCTIDFYNTSLLLDTRSESEWITHYTEDCGSGQFSLKYINNSIPFYGDIDEVQIFGQPLDEDAIRQLYLDHATLMYLPLDEAPGARAFEDASLAHVAASCAGSLCPSSGTTGRINQAAWFDRQNRTAIQLGTSPARELVNAFTVAAWIKPRSLPDWQRIVSVATNNSINGWGFGLLHDELLFTQFGVKDYTTNGLALDTDRWTHVAVVISPTNEINFYVDGALRQTLPSVGVGHQNTDDPLLVGALTGYGYTEPTQVFDGQIDDLWIFSTPLSAASIEQLYLSAPRLHLLFDEAHGATDFTDNTAYGRFATCTPPACPTTGEGVPGQIGLAAQFDGGDDYVDGSNLNPPNMNGDFTLTQWFTLDELGAASAYRDWAAPVGKGAYNATARWAVLVNRDINNVDNHRINLYLNGVVAATIPGPTGGWAPGRWYQYTFTRNGATIKGYLNGVQQTSSTATPVSVTN